MNFLNRYYRNDLAFFHKSEARCPAYVTEFYVTLVKKMLVGVFCYPNSE